MNDFDRTMLDRAMKLASQGRGFVEPNPMVGCVLVKDGQVIGEGFHHRFGQPHAEPAALANAASRGHSPAGATAYVTLEPCCHTNKKTPPCTPQLMLAGVARVVVGTTDPNDAVNGKGVRQLRAAGIDVELATGSIAKRFAQLIAPFVATQTLGRAYVTAKWAETADGFVAGASRERLSISNRMSNRIVHRLRTRCDSILVGVGTVIADDPQLTVRDIDVIRTPTRIVLDPHGRSPVNATVFDTRTAPTLVVRRASANVPLRSGVELLQIADDADALEIVTKSKLLDRTQTHLLVEPGPTLAKSFLDSNRFDRVWIIRSPIKLDRPGLPAPRLDDRFVRTGSIHVEGDEIIEFLNTHSDVFFAAEPSIDLLDAAAGIGVEVVR